MMSLLPIYITEREILDMSVGSYIDPTLFVIMGALALMFIGMCVVLRLFAKYVISAIIRDTFS